MLNELQEHIDELKYLEEKGKKLKASINEISNAKGNILWTYQSHFKAKSEFRKRISEQCFHRLDDNDKNDKRIVSWGKPMKKDYKELDRLNKGLSKVYDALSHCDEFMRKGNIELKELRSQYKDTQKSMKELISCS